MRIPEVFSGLTDSASRSRAGQVQVLPKSLDADRPRVFSADRSAKIAELASRYDVTRITPSEFSEFARKLFDAGTIGPADLAELLAIRADLDSAGIRPDQRVDLVEFYREKALTVQRQAEIDGDAANDRLISSVRRKLDWAEKLAAVHRQSDSVDVDAVA